MWVLFCFLHRLCRPSPALAHRSLQGSAQLHSLAGWTSHFSSLMQGHSPPLQELQETWLESIPALWVQQSCTLRRSICGGEGAKAGCCRLLAWLCPLGQGAGSTKQGTSAASQGKAPLTKGRNLPVHARPSRCPFLTLLWQWKGGSVHIKLALLLARLRIAS